MKFSISVLFGVLASIVGASALELDVTHVGKSLADIPMEKRLDAVRDHIDAWSVRRSLKSGESLLRKRGDVGEVAIQDSLSNIAIEVVVGSEKKKIPVLVDTGSSSTYVLDSVYQPNDSSTASDPQGYFMVGYIDGSGGKGPIVLDDFRFGDVTAKAFPFGVLPKEHHQTLPDGIGGLLAMMSPGRDDTVWYGQPHMVELLSHLKYTGTLDNRAWQIAIGKGGKMIIGKFDDSLAEGGLKEVFNSGMAKNHPGMKGKLNDGKEVFFLFDTGTPFIATSVSNAKKLYGELGVEEEPFNDNVHGMFDCKNPPKLKFASAEGEIVVEIPEEEVGSLEVGEGRCMLPIIGVDKVDKGGMLSHMPDGFILGEMYLKHLTFGVDYDEPTKLKIGMRKN